MKSFDKTKNFIIKNKYPIILLVIVLVTHWLWYFNFNILTYGDWRFWYKENLREFFSLSFVWTNLLNHSFGQLVAMITIYPVYTAYGFLAKIGFDYAVAERIIFLFPVSLISIFSSFFLIKKIINSKKAAFVGSLLFSFNTYFLKIQNSHLTIGVAYALAPLVFLSFISLLENKKIKDAIVFSLLFCLMGYYEMRIVYVLSVVLFLYFIFHLLLNKNLKKDWITYLKLFFLSSTIIILLNSFWILALVKNSTSLNSVVAGRGLFGNDFLDINYAFTFFYPFWNKGKIIPFVNQEIPTLVWFVPFFIFLSFLFWKKNRDVLFFLFLSLLGILLTKQVSPPFPNLYLWLYNNFPGFNLFREASKFFILIALGYSVSLSFIFLIAINFFKKKYLANLLFLLVTILLLFNSSTLITGKINKLFVARQVPYDYLIFKDFILKQNGFFRTFWTPANSRWGFYTNNKPTVSGVGVLANEWKKIFNFKSIDEWPRQEQIVNIFNHSFSNQLFDNSAIKYIIIPLQDIANDDDFYVSYGGKDNPNIRNWYISEIDKVEWLKKIDIGTKELVIYENQNYKPHIYSDIGLNYYQTNSSEFGDFIKNQNLYLNSEIEKNEYLLSNLDNIIIPIEADQNKIVEMELKIKNTEDTKEKRKLQNDLDLYISNLFFKDFKLQIPLKANYKIYFKKASVLANNKNVSVKVGDKVIKEDKINKDKEDWKYFGQVELDKGEYDIKLYVEDKVIDYIYSGDIVFSAENLREPIQTPILEYKQINPTKYVVNVHEAKESFPLIFSESFHPQWRIYPAELKVETKGGDKFISENNQGTIQNENLDGGKFYDLLFKKPILDDKHFMVNGFANVWWLDLAELEKDGIIKKDANNTYSFSITIEFEPQKYFYIGLAISGMTLLGCIVYLVYDWRRRRKNRVTQNVILNEVKDLQER